MRAKRPSDHSGTPAGTPAPAGPHSSQTNLKRRGFLLALGAGSAGAAAVAVQSMSGGAIAPQTAAVAGADGKGYQLTDHVRRYYRTAKI